MKYIPTILLLIFCWSAPGITAGEIWAKKIWDRDNQKFISEKSLVDRLTHSHNILMGLQMDNPAHYRIAAGIIGKLATAGRKPVILLAGVERRKQNAFAIFAARPRKPSGIYDATGLDMLLGWSHSGQAGWATVRPVFDVAMVKGLTLRAVAFSRDEIGKLYNDGLGGLPGDVKDDLGSLLATPLPHGVKTHMATEMRKAYCADLPQAVIDRLILTDRAQSSLIARNISKTGRNKAIFIGPEKFILKDSGVPRYLGKLKVKDETISLLFSEPGQKIRNPDVDFIWFTDIIPRPDPCRFLNIKPR